MVEVEDRLLNDDTSVNKPPNVEGVLEAEIAMMGLDNPNEVLDAAIAEWLVAENVKQRPNQHLIDRVNLLVEEHNTMGAVLALVDDVGEIATTRKMRQKANRLKREVKAAMSKEEVTLRKGKASYVFTLGGAAHVLIERVSRSKNEDDLFYGGFEPVIEEGSKEVVAFRERRKGGDITTPGTVLVGEHELPKARAAELFGIGQAGEIEQTASIVVINNKLRVPSGYSLELTDLATGANKVLTASELLSEPEGEEPKPRYSLKLSDKSVVEITDVQLQRIKKKKGPVRTERIDYFAEETTPAPATVELPVPLPVPKADESPVGWAVSIFQETFREIEQKLVDEDGSLIGLPQKPYDIALLFQNDELRPKLLQALEAAHFLFGFEHGLNMINWEEGTGKFDPELIDVFKTLNWLSVMRNTLEWDSGAKRLGKNHLVFTEVSEGNLNIKSKVNGNGNGKTSNGESTEFREVMKGGRLDILVLSWKGQETEEFLDEEGNIKPEKLRSINETVGLYGEIQRVLGGEGKPDFSNLSAGNYRYARALLTEMAQEPWFKDDAEDWVKRLDSESVRGRFDISLGQAMQVIQGKFNLQTREYRRRGMVDGRIRETSTRNSRNSQTIFRELFKIYGYRIFTQLDFNVRELKCPAGDGTWLKVFNPETYDPKHYAQLSDYLFRLTTQLYWVERWANQQIEVDETTSTMTTANNEKEPISVEEVLAFMEKYGLNRRVHGNLLYQLPAREIEYEVRIGSDEAELSKWGERAFGISESNRELKMMMQVYTGLGRLLNHKIKQIPRSEEETKVQEIPASLESLFYVDRGTPYLCIDRLMDFLDERLCVEGAKVDNAVWFKNEDVKVMWLSGLLPDLPNIRLAIDRKGRFALYAIRPKTEKEIEEDPVNEIEHVSIKGSLLTRYKNWGIDESRDHLYRTFDGSVWKNFGRKWNLKVGFGSKSESHTDILEGPLEAEGLLAARPKDGVLYVVYPDGSTHKKVPEKPGILKWDPMGAAVFDIDMEALQRYAESGGERHDIWGYLELWNAFSERQASGVAFEMQVKCPSEGHNNVRTKAARLYSDHISCFRERIAVRLPVLDEKREKVPVTQGLEVSDYKPVSADRAKVFGEFMSVARNLARVSELPQQYLLQRGLSIDLIPGVGFIPLEMERALTTIMTSETYRTQLKAMGREVRLDQLAVLFAKKEITEPGVFEALKTVTTILYGLEYHQTQEAIKSLSLGGLDDMRRRNIWEVWRKKSGETVVKHRKGNRIILETYWISERGKPPFLVPSNVNARGIRMNGEDYYEELDEPHHKAHLGFTKKKKEGTELVLRPTPVGFWFPDPERFLEKADDTLIVYEGLMNHLTANLIFGKTSPEFADIGLTNVGLGHRELMAFLRWRQEVLGKKPKNLFYAVDFDEAGIEAWDRNKERFERAFPGMKVWPIHEILPQDIRMIIPPPDAKSFDEGQLWEGVHMDLNDLINMQGPTFDIESWRSRMIKDYINLFVRPNYAFIPQGSLRIG